MKVRNFEFDLLNTTRLQILAALNNVQLSAVEIRRTLGTCTTPNIYHHLKILKNLEFIIEEVREKKSLTARGFLKKKNLPKKERTTFKLYQLSHKGQEALEYFPSWREDKRHQNKRRILPKESEKI